MHKTSKHSVDADGFGVCFEMGKKCYMMSALYIPSLNRTHWKTQASICFVRPFYIKGTGDIFPLFIKILTSFEDKKFLLKSSTNFERFFVFFLG